LYSLNREVNSVNAQHFGKLPGPTILYEAVDSATGPDGAKKCLPAVKRDCQAPKHLELKKNAQVILLKNIDPETGLCNGSRGVVIDLVHRDLIQVGERGYFPDLERANPNCRILLRKNPVIPLVLFACGTARFILPAGECANR
jgi:hypothetical protein